MRTLTSSADVVALDGVYSVVSAVDVGSPLHRPDAAKRLLKLTVSDGATIFGAVEYRLLPGPPLRPGAQLHLHGVRACGNTLTGEIDGFATEAGTGVRVRIRAAEPVEEGDAGGGGTRGR